MDWRQLGPTLADNANVKLPREAIEQHLADNPVQLNRIEKGVPPERFEDLTPQQKEWITTKANRISRGGFETPPDQLYSDLKVDENLPADLFPQPKWQDYTLPGGENYRERLFQLPGGENQFTSQQGSHWDEPNILFHRRSTDRVFDEGDQPIRSLHDEENQSDWHQQGRDKGYTTGKEVFPENAQLFRPDPDGDPQMWQWRKAPNEDPSPVFWARDANTAWRLAEEQWKKGLGQIPDAPFKGSGWERLALHDQLREAAEKGYPRISWTAGEENTTNPMVMLRDEGRSLSEYSPERQAEIFRADKGIRDYYNRRRVDQANKVGKAHGVQVQRSSLPREGGMSGGKAMDILGIHPMHREDYWDRLTSDYGNQPEIPSGDLQGHNLTRQELLDAAREKGIATYHMDIPDSLRRELLTKPMSLFEDTGGLGKAAAAAQQTEQQAPPGTTYANWMDALEGRPNTTYASWFDALEGRPRR
jgi:hypothetical protein